MAAFVAPLATAWRAACCTGGPATPTVATAARLAARSIEEPLRFDEGRPSGQPRERRQPHHLHMCRVGIVVGVLVAVLDEPAAYVVVGGRLPAAAPVDEQLVARHLAARRNVFGAARVLQRSLGGSEPRDRHAIRRAADVVEPELVAELHGGTVAPMLAADADLDVRLRAPPPLDADPHQVADAALVERLERIVLDHSVVEIE